MFKKIKKNITSIFHKSNFYKLLLNLENKENIILRIVDPWSGNGALADEIFQGRYNFAGQEIHAPRKPLWDPPGVGIWWLSEMHGFSWLRHFKARDGQTSQQHSRALITHWINSGHKNFNSISWRADILGRRVCSWIAHSDLLLEGADENFRENFLKVLSSQAKHLSNVIEKSDLGPEKYTALRGLLASGLALSNGKKRLHQAKKILFRNIEKDIFQDGCFKNGQASATLEILSDLLWIRSCLYDHDAVPEILSTTITKMSLCVRSMRLGDGTLTRANGGKAFSRESIDKILEKTGIKLNSRISASLTTSGYERLAAGRTTIIMDCNQNDNRQYAGSLSFEMSVGRDRLIVNCGPSLIRNKEWEKALSASAAHSTLVLNNTNSSSYKKNRTPNINIIRTIKTGEEQIRASHNGYLKNFSAKHERILQLDKRGVSLLGSDNLISGPGHKFKIHFHLHPRANAQLSRNNEKILISLPSGGWEFYLLKNKNNYTLETVKSIYIEDDNTKKNTSQIIIIGETSNTGAKINWCFKKSNL